MLSVVQYDKRNSGYLNKVKPKGSDIVEFVPIPNPYLRVYSSGIVKPKLIEDLKRFKIQNLTEFSKLIMDDKKAPNSIVFIERINSTKYNLWEMKAMIRE